MKVSTNIMVRYQSRYSDKKKKAAETQISGFFMQLSVVMFF